MIEFCVGYLCGLATFGLAILVANVAVYGSYSGREKP